MIKWQKNEKIRSVVDKCIKAMLISVLKQRLCYSIRMDIVHNLFLHEREHEM
ncbi:MAG: hypothetical protein WAM14_02320 [Candidatus Nitrosopolaris sp.]